MIQLEYKLPINHDSDEVSSVTSTSSSISSLNNIENNCSTDSADFNRISSEKRIKSIEDQLSSIHSQVAKTEQELTKETNKLNSNNLQIERHGINLVEWENYMKMKITQMNQFVKNFKQNVHYSNETQLHKQLFQNRIYCDLNSEIFTLEEKIDYLTGLITPLHSVAYDLRLKVVELNARLATLHSRQVALRAQLKKDVNLIK